MSFGLKSAPIMPGNQTQSLIYEEKVNVDHAAPPVHHIALGVGALLAAVLVVGYLNHHANR